jgi:polysaccharide biosynthesis protein PslG
VIGRDHEEARSLMFHASAHDDNAAATSSTGLRRSGVIAVVICFGLLLAAVAPTTAVEAKKVPKGFFGLAQGGVTDAKDFKKMGDIKVRTYRLSVTWRAVEPQADVYNWSHIDGQVGALAKNGITPVISIWGSPSWATGSGYLGVPPLKGTAKDAWKSFLKTLVNRYKKGGEYWRTNPSVPKKPVKFWQIWNEPNLPKYFTKPGSNPPKSVPKTAKSYAKLVKSSDKAISKADKHGKIVLAGLSSKVKKKKLDPNHFIKKFLKTKKITKRFDAAALHPYAPKISKYKSRVSKFRKAMKKAGGKKKGIWLTEVGWGSKHGHGSLNKGKSGQAKLLKKAFKVTLKNRKKWKIDHAFWYDWRDPPRGAPVGCSFCPSAGLLKNNRKPKPAYKQFKHFTMKGGGHHHHHVR